MRSIFLSMLAVISVSASPAPVVDTPSGLPQAPSDGALATCADRIETVRDTLGQPRLDRTPESIEEPLLIAAVDKRIDGCAVMQMKGDVNDLRPIPQPAPGSPFLQPAR